MTETERDQRPLGMVRQYLPSLILNTMLETIREMDHHHRARPGPGGVAAHPPKAMAVVCILMEAGVKTYGKIGVIS